MPKDLTSESLKKLLDALSVDEAEASRLYTNLRGSLVRFFQLKGLSDADKAADETLDRVADKINQKAKIENLRKFAFGIARFVFLEKHRQEQSRARSLEGFYLKDSATNEFEESDDVEAFRECFKQLYDHERELLLRYFEDLPSAELFESRQKLAKREKIDINALRNRISRLRKRLEECLGKQK